VLQAKTWLCTAVKTNSKPQQAPVELASFFFPSPLLLKAHRFFLSALLRAILENALSLTLQFIPLSLSLYLFLPPWASLLLLLEYVSY